MTITTVWPYSAYGLKNLLALQVHSIAGTVDVSVLYRRAVFIPVLPRPAHLCQQSVCLILCRQGTVQCLYDVLVNEFRE